MGLVDHAKYELDLILKNCTTESEKEMQQLMNKDLLETVDLIAKQGHSGLSMGYFKDNLIALLSYKNLTPLTGEDAEWCDISNMSMQPMFQNKRYSTVFKQSDRFNGQAYTVDGKIFSYDNGKSWVSNRHSHTPITFPYYPQAPKKVYIHFSIQYLFMDIAVGIRNFYYKYKMKFFGTRGK